MNAQTPRQAAETEAARQAVMLAFGVAGAVILMIFQKRLMRGLLPGGPGPMEEAAARERRWGKAAAWCWRRDLISLARRAGARAEQARADYEAARP